jgi:hypothetical protein
MDGRDWSEYAVGSLIHYAFSATEHRAAVVIRVNNWTTGVLNMAEFNPNTGTPTVRTNVPYANTGAAGTWHFRQDIDDRTL